MATASSAAVRSTVTPTATSTQVLGVNVNRVTAVFFNSGTAGNVFLALGAAAQSGTGDYSYKILPGATVELPARFTGLIQAIWDTTSGAGNLIVTELT